MLQLADAPQEILTEGLLDEEQTQAVAHLRSILAMGSPFVLYIEGAELTGRRTAVSLATGEPALAIDLAQSRGLRLFGFCRGDAVVSYA